MSEFQDWIKQLLAEGAATEQPNVDMEALGNAFREKYGDFPVVRQSTENTAAQAEQAKQEAEKQEAEKIRLAQIQARNNWIQNHDAQTAKRDAQYRANAPILSTGELPFAQEQLAAKYMYSMADDPNYQKSTGMTADQIREAASNAATRSRAIAQSAGYNLNDGYGSDVSLERATDNLASNAARARLDILQGKYSQTADQFYEQRYRDLVAQGERPRMARHLAGQDAQKFQAEKVAYLSDMLEGYGLNGGYLNALGAKMVGMIGNADSEMGNYYAKMYGSPLDAQQRANTVEDAIRGHEFGQENSLMTAYLNEWAAQNGLPRDLTKIRASADYGLRNGLQLGDQRHGQDIERMTYQDALDQRKELRKLQAAQAGMQQKFEFLDKLRASGAITDEQYIGSIAAVQGITIASLKGNPKDLTKEQLTGVKTLIDVDIKQRDSIIKQMQATEDPKALKGLKAQLTNLDEEIKGLKQTYGDLLNPDPGVDKATGDYQQDAAALNQLWSAANGNEDTYKQLVENWLTASGVSGVSQTVYMGTLPIPKKK